MSKARKIVYFILSAVVTAGMAVMFAFVFPESFVRFAESVRDLALAVGGYFCVLFGVENINFNAGAVNMASGVLSLDIIVNVETIKAKFVHFGKAFINWHNFVTYCSSMFNSFGVFFTVLLIVLPVALILIILAKVFLMGENLDIGKKSVPLKAYILVERAVFYPIMSFFRGLIDFLKTYRWILYVWGITWLVGLNVGTIFIEFFASIFYFVSHFDFSGVFVQLEKLICDISVWMRVPLPVYVIGFIIGIFVVRERIARNRLYSREGRNGKFVKHTSSALLVASVMGAGKTRFITDFILTKQAQLRQQALDIMLEIDYMFPEFPWEQLRKDVDALVKSRTIFNIYSAHTYGQRIAAQLDKYVTKDYIRKAYAKALRTGRISHDYLLYGYDWRKCGVVKNVGNKFEKLGDCLRDYIKAYFIYSSPSSMIFSNYAISVRTQQVGNGNLPRWFFNFFGDIVSVDEPRQNAHIADMDMFRLGRIKQKQNPRANAFEYGIAVVSEVDKERGNQFDTAELKKSADDANQKNDLFNTFLMMSRQITNIRNRSFFCILGDMQRFGSLNAAMVDLADDVTLEKASDVKMLMPFFALDELLYHAVVGKFEDTYLDYISRRGDNTLLMYLYKKASVAIYNHYNRMYNKYGCIEQKLNVNEKEEYMYYIMPKKIYADVYSSDIMASYFRTKAGYSRLGINDIPVYKGVRATFDELRQQNSYLVDSWLENLQTLSEGR